MGQEKQQASNKVQSTEQNKSENRLYNNEFTYEDLGSATQVKLDAKSQPEENVAAAHLKAEQMKVEQAERKQ